jgi:hypothetical protein
MSTGVNMEVWERALRVITTFLRDAAMGGTVGSTDPGDDLPAGVAVESPFTYSDGDVELEVRSSSLTDHTWPVSVSPRSSAGRNFALFHRASSPTRVR